MSREPPDFESRLGLTFNNKKWIRSKMMKLCIFLLAALVSAHMCRAQLVGTILEYNQQIQAGDSIGSFRTQLGVTENGTFYIGDRETIIVAEGAGTGSSLVMQGDGNLVLYRADGTVHWSSGTDGNHGAKLDFAREAFTDERYTGDTYRIVDVNGSVLKRFQFKGCKGFQLGIGEKLFPGEYLCFGRIIWGLGQNGKIQYNSPVGGEMKELDHGTATHIVMQGDGNLVAYEGVNPVWSTGTAALENHGSALYMIYSSGPRILGTGGNLVWAWSFHYN